MDAVVASSREFTSPSPVGSSETQALLAALKPPKRGRPVITSIGINDATETTDYLMPHGILRRADVADVVLLATQPGPVTLFPALKVQPHATVAEFDDRQPDGADYVIVPAMSRDDDRVVLEWLRSQAAKGALMRGCRDARPSRHTDLAANDFRLLVAGDRLDQGQRHRHGRADSRCRRHTIVNPVCDNGPPKWSRHLVDAGGQFDPPLALIADAWSRTYRSRAVTFAPDGATRESRNGIQIVPDEVRSSWPAATRLPAIDSQPARALDEALDAIRTRYGPRTFDFVAMQLDYPTEPVPVIATV